MFSAMEEQKLARGARSDRGCPPPPIQAEGWAISRRVQAWTRGSSRREGQRPGAQRRQTRLPVGLRPGPEASTSISPLSSLRATGSMAPNDCVSCSITSDFFKERICGGGNDPKGSSLSPSVEPDPSKGSLCLRPGPSPGPPRPAPHQQGKGGRRQDSDAGEDQRQRPRLPADPPGARSRGKA